MDNYDDDDDIPNMDRQYATLTEFLTQNRDMKQTATYSMKQGLLAGAGAVAGGCLLGPVGGLMGGVVGSVYGYMQAPNYEGMVQQVVHLEGSTRAELLKQVQATLVSAGATGNLQSPAMLQAALVQFASQKHVREQIWKACVTALDE